MTESSSRVEVSATVTVVSPLAVVVDGAVTACPADKHTDVASLVVGARVTVTDRAPRRPLVTGIVEGA